VRLVLKTGGVSQSQQHCHQIAERSQYMSWFPSTYEQDGPPNPLREAP